MVDTVIARNNGLVLYAVDDTTGYVVDAKSGEKFEPHTIVSILSKGVWELTDKMPSAKLTLRLKGGSGSGFHGHAGIPGHQGGSQAADSYQLWNGDYRSVESFRKEYEEYNTLDELRTAMVKAKSAGAGTEVCYWIDLNGKLITQRLKTRKIPLHTKIALSMILGKDPRITDVTAENIAHAVAFADAGEDTIVEDVLLRNGFIKVRQNTYMVGVSVKNLNQATMRKLQKLYDVGKLPIGMYDIADSDGNVIHKLSFEDFIGGKRLIPLDYGFAWKDMAEKQTKLTLRYKDKPETISK
jgi:hypothetical protein